MKKNKLSIIINKDIPTIFNFVITPPNSTKWIPGVVVEKTSHWPIKIGTIYYLTDRNGGVSEVIVEKFIKNKIVGWKSKDGRYHCEYRFKKIDNSKTKFIYNEWVDEGEIDGPFTIKTLNILKSILEID